MKPNQSSPSPSDDAGFSLPEVLVAILIVGVLAAIAIPAFLGTTAKATDVQAKELAHTAQNAAEAFASDNGGSYANLSPAGLAAEEPTIATKPGKGQAYLSEATATEAGAGYTVTATATNGVQLTVARSAEGTISRTCKSPVTKTGCSEGETGSW